MSLNFPNPSRSYDSDQRRIRFWGHDGSMEVMFFIDENAVFKLAPKTLNIEVAILAAFDAARDRIMSAARRVYAPHDRRRFYTLGTADF